MALLTVTGTAKAAVYYVDTTSVESDNIIATVAQAKANPGIDTVYRHCRIIEHNRTE